MSYENILKQIISVESKEEMASYPIRTKTGKVFSVFRSKDKRIFVSSENKLSAVVALTKHNKTALFFG